MNRTTHIQNLIVSYCQPCPCPLIKETATPTSKKLTEYDTDRMAQYSSTLLWNIGKLSWYDYSKFQLNNITRSRVIELESENYTMTWFTQVSQVQSWYKIVSLHTHTCITASPFWYYCRQQYISMFSHQSR